MDVALLQARCRGPPRRVTVAEAELQRKATIPDTRKRAADTMKRRREPGEDYYRKPAQDAGDGLRRSCLG